MVSYADFMTLLFAFFVVLYSSSQVDKPRWSSLSNAITAGFQQLGVGSGPGAPVVIPGTTPLPATHPASSEETAEAIRPKLELELRRRARTAIPSPCATLPRASCSAFANSDSSIADRQPCAPAPWTAFDRIGSVLASGRQQSPHRRPHRQRSHPYRSVPVQLGTLHRARHRDHSPPVYPRRHCSRPRSPPPAMPSTTPSPTTPPKTDAASIAASISSSSCPIGSAIRPRFRDRSR